MINNLFNYLPKIRGHTRKTMSACMSAALLWWLRQGRMNKGAKRGEAWLFHYATGTMTSCDAPLKRPLSNDCLLYLFILPPLIFVAHSVIIKQINHRVITLEYIELINDPKIVKVLKSFLQRKERPQQAAMRQHMTVSESLSCCYPVPQRD